MIRVTVIMIRLVITNSRFLMGLILSTKTKSLGTFLTKHWPTIKKLINTNIKIAQYAGDAKKAKDESDKFIIKGVALDKAEKDLDIIEKRYNSAITRYNKILDRISKAKSSKARNALRKQLPMAKRIMTRSKTQYDTKKKIYDKAVNEFETQIIDTYLAFKNLLAATGQAIS